MSPLHHKKTPRRVVPSKKPTPKKKAACAAELEGREVRNSPSGDDLFWQTTKIRAVTAITKAKVTMVPKRHLIV